LKKSKLCIKPVPVSTTTFQAIVHQTPKRYSDKYEKISNKDTKTPSLIQSIVHQLVDEINFDHDDTGRQSKKHKQMEKRKQMNKHKQMEKQEKRKLKEKKKVNEMGQMKKITQLTHQ